MPRPRASPPGRAEGISRLVCGEIGPEGSLEIVLKRVASSLALKAIRGHPSRVHCCLSHFIILVSIVIVFSIFLVVIVVLHRIRLTIVASRLRTALLCLPIARATRPPALQQSRGSDEGIFGGAIAVGVHCERADGSSGWRAGGNQPCTGRIHPSEPKRLAWPPSCSRRGEQ
jgi:hypothetical protein